MADINKLIPHILKWEGGFVNDPDDAGGATNMGVTIGTYTEYCREKGCPAPTVEDLKNISMVTWVDILRTMYWNRYRADEIESQSVANICVDWLWHSGCQGIIKVQKILGVKADGIVGPITLAAINSASPLPLFGKIKQEREKFFRKLVATRPTNSKYLRGWMNRLDDLNFDD